METLECIKTRRSIRSFVPKDIPESIIREILTAGIHAPSSGNIQNWEFIVVRDRKTKKLLSESALHQKFIEEAGVVIVVCSDWKRVERAYGRRGRELYSVQNTAAAIQNILLAAWDLGLGTCWIGAFDEEDVKKILKIPKDIKPVAIIPVGYPENVENKPERKSLEKVLHKEKW